ncbi:MAG: hypothetical protein JWN70_5609, partial [Planctomycetaceae bacterium]|nr:hypothetical protein [Planctomycetaceae bacterium]
MPQFRRRALDPVGARLMLEKLGPVFIKIGQFLALRPDLIPQEYCNEFLKLADDVAHEPWPLSRQVIFEDLGQLPEEAFDWIDTTPLAAGSLAQVYRARTHDGDEVVIKVQRSGVLAAVERDLRRLRRASHLISWSGIFGTVSIPEVLGELERWLKRELDLVQELRGLTRMWRLAQDSPRMYAPRPYPTLSGRRVLTAEFLDGISLSRILRAGRDGGIDDKARLDYEPTVLSTNLIHSILTQIFRYRFFHADTHPGNLIVLPNNRIGYVDFGLTDILDEAVRSNQAEYFRALYSGDVNRIHRALTNTLIATECADPDGLRANLREAT